MNDEGIHRLCAGIVARACKDYVLRKRHIINCPVWTSEHDYRKALLEETKNFFLGSWYEVIMPNIDGESVLKRLDEIAISSDYEKNESKGEDYVCK